VRNEKWKELLDKYLIVKKLYIECDETDPELKTNAQPLNELRMTLDHVFRLIYCEIDSDENLGAGVDFEDEFKKASNHVCVAFFDVCDMLSMNYRRKIHDFLRPYSPDVISKALPDYYPSWILEVEKISACISEYRATEKGKPDDNALFSKYYEDVISLKKIFSAIINASPSLYELRRKEKKEKFMPIISYIVGILGLIFAVWSQFLRN